MDTASRDVSMKINEHNSHTSCLKKDECFGGVVKWVWLTVLIPCVMSSEMFSTAFLMSSKLPWR